MNLYVNDGINELDKLRFISHLHAAPFIIENNNREMPQLVVYDIRKVFPQFDKYHETNELQEIDGSDVRHITAGALRELDEPKKKKKDKD